MCVDREFVEGNEIREIEKVMNSVKAYRTVSTYAHIEKPQIV